MGLRCEWRGILSSEFWRFVADGDRGGLYGPAAATALEDLPYDARGILSGLYQVCWSSAATSGQSAGRTELTIVLARICSGLYARSGILSSAGANHFSWLAKPLLVSTNVTLMAIKCTG
jgi:hypothetical protein